MYRPIDPIGLNFPADGRYGRSRLPHEAQKRTALSRVPQLGKFMLSQNGLAKAKPLNLQS
jgi:hypothetical protein